MQNKWSEKFKPLRTSVKHPEGAGRLSSSTTDKKIERQAQQMVLTDPCTNASGNSTPFAAFLTPCDDHLFAPFTEVCHSINCLQMKQYTKRRMNGSMTSKKLEFTTLWPTRKSALLYIEKFGISLIVFAHKWK